MTNIPPKTSEAATTPQPSTSETPLAIPDPTNKVEIPATPATPTAPETLDSLKAKIIEAHAAFCSAMADIVVKAKIAGELLIKAKPIVGHNNFKDWIKDECEFSYSTASVYMRVAKNWAKIEAKAKKQPTALLTLEQANELTIKKKRIPAKVTNTTTPSPTPATRETTLIKETKPSPLPIVEQTTPTPGIPTGDIILQVCEMGDVLEQIIADAEAFEDDQRRILVESLQSAKGLIDRALSVLNSPNNTGRAKVIHKPIMTKPQPKAKVVGTVKIPPKPWDELKDPRETKDPSDTPGS